MTLEMRGICKSFGSNDVLKHVDFSIQGGEICALLGEKGFSIGNIDATLIAQRPKLAPFIPQMRENLAKACGVSLSQVSVKATTEEGLGFTGSGEGMAASAVCLLEN